MQATLITLILALILTACGRDDSSSPAPAATTPVATETAPAPVQSIALQSAADLPACTAANDKQLVYVLESKSFLTCQSGAWVSIEVAGPAGKDGAPGKDGMDGNDGHDGRPVPVNTWIDPFTGRAWVRGGLAASGDACTVPGFRLPTNDEAFEAVRNGLFVGVTSPVDLWTSAGSVVSSGHAFVSTAGVHGISCIKL